MRWRKAQLMGMRKVGEDALHKPIEQEEKLSDVLVRLAPVAASSDGTEGNAFKYVTRTFFTAAPKARFEGASSIAYGGEAYRIDRVSESASGTVVTATRSKP